MAYSQTIQYLCMIISKNGTYMQGILLRCQGEPHRLKQTHACVTKKSSQNRNTQMNLFFLNLIKLSIKQREPLFFISHCNFFSSCNQYVLSLFPFITEDKPSLVISVNHACIFVSLLVVDLVFFLSIRREFLYYGH